MPSSNTSAIREHAISCEAGFELPALIAAATRAAKLEHPHRTSMDGFREPGRTESTVCVGDCASHRAGGSPGSYGPVLSESLATS